MRLLKTMEDPLEASKPISYQNNKAISNLGDILFFFVISLARDIIIFLRSATQSAETICCSVTMVFCLCNVSFACKNSYFIWAVLEYFSESRRLLQREEKVKERVSNNGSNGLSFVSNNIFRTIETST